MIKTGFIVVGDENAIDQNIYGFTGTTARLTIVGTGTTAGIQYIDNNQGAGKVLTSDSEGNVSWQPAAGGDGGVAVGWSGSTQYSVGTYVDSNTICANPGLLYNNGCLNVGGSRVYFHDIGIIEIGTTINSASGSSDSIIIGKNSSICSGSINSVTIGCDSVILADSYDSINVGRGNKIDTNSRSGIVIGTIACVGANVIYGTAIGYGAKAASNYTIAIGWCATSITTANDKSIVMGCRSTTCSSCSIAIGGDSLIKTGSTTSIAIGHTASVGSTSNNSIAIGGLAQVGDVSNFSIAIGQEAKTYERYGITLGYNTRVCDGALYSTTVGYNSYVQSSCGVVLGLKSAITTGSTSSIVIGDSSLVSTCYSIAMGYGARVNAGGRSNIAIGELACVCDDSNYNVAINRSIVCGSFSVAIGHQSQVRSCNSIGMGDGSIICPSSNYSISLGSQTKVLTNSQYGIAIGRQACVGANSGSGISIGHLSNTSSLTSISMGYNSYVYSGSTNSIAIGSWSKVSYNSSNSIAIGCRSWICDDSDCTIAIGFGADIGNDSRGSIAFGTENLICDNVTCSTVIGNYSSIKTGSTGVFLFGNYVCSNENESNMFGIGWSNSVPDIKFSKDNPSYIMGSNPRLGLGTTAATARLEIIATGATDGFKLVDGNQQSGYVLTSDANGVATWQSGSTTSNNSKAIVQPSHGFTVGDFLGWSGGTYNKAIADGTYDGEFVGIVSNVVDTNTFTLTQAGYISGLSSLTPNTTYWLSTTVEGALTDVEPLNGGDIAKAVLVADTATSAWVLPYAGFIISTGDTSGNTILDTTNGLTLNVTTLELGGTLCKSTTIDVDAYQLRLGAVSDLIVCSNYVGMSSTSGGSSTCCSKIITCNGPDIILSVCGDTGKIEVDDSTSTPNGIVYKQCYSTGFTSTCSLVDKGYVDNAISTGVTLGGGGEYTCVTAYCATCTIGGIPAGTALTGLTLECIIQLMLAPYIVPDFTSFNVSQASYTEVGDTVSGTRTFTWTTCGTDNVASNSIGIYDVTNSSLLGSGLANDGSQVLSINAMGNTSATTWTWQITGCSTQNGVFTRNVNKYSVYPYYWGVETCATRPDVTNALVTGGTKVVDSSTGTVTVDFNSVGQWTWLAIPSLSTSKTCWYVDGINNGDIGNTGDKYPDECVLAISTSNWTGINYKVYMSKIAGTDSDPIEFRNS